MEEWRVMRCKRKKNNKIKLSYYEKENYIDVIGGSDDVANGGASRGKKDINICGNSTNCG